MTKKHRRYTEPERARILALATRDGLTGKQAAKRFGVSEVSLWKWRKATKTAPREQSSRRVQKDGSLAGLVRAEVRAKVRELLPGIVAEEVARALDPGSLK